MEKNFYFEWKKNKLINRNSLLPITFKRERVNAIEIFIKHQGEVLEYDQKWKIVLQKMRKNIIWSLKLIFNLLQKHKIITHWNTQMACNKDDTAQF